MTALILGLVIFLGVHSVRIVAEPWRTRMRARLGEGAWKGLYSLLSLLGFGLIVWGYGLARQQPVSLWAPMPWARHLASLLTLLAFVLLVAAYVPGNSIKARLHHPMTLDQRIDHIAAAQGLGTGPPAGQPHAGRPAVVRRFPALGSAEFSCRAPA
jgi:uncharacterized membrane protein